MKKIDVFPIKQTGHICKPTAIATIERYYARQNNFPAIPLNKRNNPFHHYKKHPVSIRQLAKRFGSVQGELLEIQQVESLLALIGYASEWIDFNNNFDLFKQVIIKNINAGNLIFAAFSVDMETKRPITQPDDKEDQNEHATVIHGYDEEHDILYLTHDAKERTCTFKEFYDSSMVLLDTRKPEYYKDVKRTAAKRYKYDLCDPELEEPSLVKKSIEPQLNTGFRAKLLVVITPNLEHLREAREKIGIQFSPVSQMPFKPFHSMSAISELRHSKLTLDMKHIAHVFLDGELGGTPLEGWTFLQALVTFNDFLNELVLAKSKPNSLSFIIEKLAQSPLRREAFFFSILKGHLEVLYYFEKREYDIIDKYTRRSFKLNEIKEDLYALSIEVLDALKVQGDVFMHGGFSGHPSHSMLYRLNKQKNSIYFCAYDSSNAVFYDSALLASGKVKPYPIYAFSIPESVDPHRLSQFLVKLFELCVLPKIDDKQFTYNERNLYQVLHFAPTLLDGMVLPSDKLAKPTSAQRSGTCVWKSIENFIGALIPESSTYRQLLLAYKLYCFNKINICFKELEPIPPNITVLLKRSLARLAHELNEELKKKSSNWPLDCNDVKEITSYFKRWKTSLTRVELKINQHVVYFNGFYEYSKSLAVSVNAVDPKPIKHVEDKVRAYELQGKTFDDALETLCELLRFSNLNASTYARSIEQFCFYFTFSNEIKFSRLVNTLEQQQHLIDTLLQILERYQGYHLKLTPRAVIVYLSLMSIIDRLGKQKIFHFKQEPLMGPPLYRNYLHDFINRLLKNPFLSTFDPQLDCMWVRLSQFYHDKPVEEPIHYYSRLCDQSNEEEKKVLAFHWEQISSGNQKESVELIVAVNKLFFQVGHPSYYCYLNRKEREKLIASLPELSAAFQIQKSIETFLVSCLQKMVVCSYGHDHSSLVPLSPDQDIEIKKRYVHDPKYNELSVDLKLRSILITSKMYNEKFFFLKRELLGVNEQHTDTLVNAILLSSYDGNAPDSQAASYCDTTFREHSPVIALNYQLRWYPLLRDISSEQFVTKLLHHLRVSSSCQVLGLLSELSLHPNWLIGKEWERYVFLSVFQPTSLLVALESRGDLWVVLETLWIKNNGNVPEQEWFVLKLATMISNYALEAQRQGLIVLNENDWSSIVVWQERMLPAVNRRLEVFSQNNDLEQLGELHHLRLIVLLSDSKKHLPSNREIFLESYWLLALIPCGFATREEELVQHTLEKASNYLANTHISKQMVGKILNRIGVTSETAEQQLVDFARRTVTINEKIVCFLPRFIRNMPEFCELFRREDPLVTNCQVTIQQQIYEVYQWENNNQLYRVLVSHNNEQRFLQSYFNHRWYYYAAPSAAMKKYLGFYCAAFDNPPALLNQIHFRVWVADKTDWNVIDLNTRKVVYERNGQDCTFKTIACELQSNHRMADSVVVLLRFDAPQFIRLTEKHVYFERYNLVMMKTKEGYKTEDGRYTVTRIPQEDWFGSGLFLRDNLDGSYVLMMPIQSYYVQKNPITGGAISLKDKTRYMWVHDLSDKLKKELLFGNTEPNSHPGWYYPGSENYVMFKINEHKEPIANSSQDQLYLAYLYLAQDRPKKALKYLRMCVMQGSFQEMERLWWLVTKLPDSNKFTMSNSRVIAVQLKVLHDMLQLIKYFPSWKDTEPNLSVDNCSNTGRYREQSSIRLLNFINKLPKKIASYYRVYDDLRDFIPVSMRLHPAEEKLILSYCIAVQRGNSRASNKIFSYVDVLASRYLEYFPDNELTAYFKVQRNTMPAVTFHLKPEKWQEWFTDIPYSKQHFFNLSVSAPKGREADKALQALNIFMDEAYLLKNFSTYYTLALTSKELSVQECLRNFCKMAIAYYSNEDNENRAQDYCFLLISEILWAGSHIPKRFSKYSPSLESTFQSIGKLSKITLRVKDSIPPIECFKLVSKSWDEHVIEVKKKVSSEKERRQVIRHIDLNLPISSVFSIIYKQLMTIESQFQKAEQEIFSRLNALPDCFEEQNNMLETLGNDVLVLWRKKREGQHTLLHQYQDRIFTISFAMEKKHVRHRIEQIKNATQSILDNRIPDISEFEKTRIVPTIEQLLQFYLEWHDSDFQNIGISEHDIPVLYQAIESLFVLHNSLKRLHIVEEAVKAYKNNETSITKDHLIQALLNQQPITNTHQALFEYMNQLALRPEQLRFLKLIFSHFSQNRGSASQVLQLIMGGGKTKVILPLWAYEMADGDTLAIVLVPETSLKTNFSDLVFTSRYSFQQEAYCLHFDRHEAADSEWLQELYETLQIARLEKRYIISTPATWQSIELKYIDILNQAPMENDNEREQQLLWLGKILRLIRDKGIVAVDEVHSLLQIRKELNYALGKLDTLDQEDINTMVDFYLWLEEKPSSIREYLDNPGLIMDEIKIKQLMREFIQNLCHATQKKETSYWIKNLLGSCFSKSELEGYLCGEPPSQTIIERLTDHCELKKQWDLLRYQFQILMPITLRRKLYQDYGPSPNAEIPFAIPYRANNVPTQLRFGNVLEAMNYTIQMMMVRGLTFYDLRTLLRRWQEEARLERLENNNQQSLAEVRFISALGEQQHFDLLLALNLDDQNLLEQIHHVLRYNRVLLGEAIKACLSRLTFERQILRSDAINLVSQFQSVVAFTGTPGNHRTYHQDIHMVYETTLGVDVQIIQYLNERASLCHTDSEHIYEFLEEQLKDPGKKIRALIDYGGFFRGISNREIAQTIAVLFERKALSHIKHILFYQKDKLFAWDVKAKTDKPLSSTQPNMIQAELKCTENERFTIYDQEHSEGADISQDEVAFGILTIDYTTGELSKMLQAAMRMRGLGNKQSLIIAVNQTGLTLDSLISQLKCNEQKLLQEDHFRAGLRKIHNVFRCDLLERILCESDQKQRDNLFKKAINLFIYQQNDFTALGQNTQVKSTHNILIYYYEQVKQYWTNALAIDEEKSSLSSLDAISRQIIDNTLSICAPFQLSGVTQIGHQVEQQQEQQTEVRKQILSAEEEVRVILNPIDCSWVNQCIGGERPFSLPLISSVVLEQYPEINFGFSSSLYASYNFLYAYKDQKAFYSAYTKPGLSMLFLIEKNGNVRGILVCMEEAEYAHKIIREIKSETWPVYCLMTLTGHKYHILSNLVQKEQQQKMLALLEQGQFFTGKINALLSQKLSPWFHKDFPEKIKFLENISSFSGIGRHELEQLQNRLMRINYYIDYWVKSPKKVDQWTHKEPPQIVKRIDKIISILAEIDKHKYNLLFDLNSYHLDDLLLEDVYLIRRYFFSWKWRISCSKQEFSEAITLFQQHKKFIDYAHCFKYISHGGPTEIYEQFAEDYSSRLIEFLQSSIIVSLLENLASGDMLSHIKMIFDNFETCEPILGSLESYIRSLDLKLDAEKVCTVLFGPDGSLRRWQKDDLKYAYFVLETVIGPEYFVEFFSSWEINKKAILLAEKYHMCANLIHYFLFKSDGSLRRWQEDDLEQAYFILRKTIQSEFLIDLFSNYEAYKKIISFVQTHNMHADVMHVFLFKSDGSLRQWQEDDLESAHFILEKITNSEKIIVLFSNWDAWKSAIRIVKKSNLDVDGVQDFHFDDHKNLQQWNTQDLKYVYFLLCRKYDDDLAFIDKCILPYLDFQQLKIILNTLYMDPNILRVQRWFLQGLFDSKEMGADISSAMVQTFFFDENNHIHQWHNDDLRFLGKIDEHRLLWEILSSESNTKLFRLAKKFYRSAQQFYSPDDISIRDFLFDQTGKIRQWNDGDLMLIRFILKNRFPPKQVIALLENWSALQEAVQFAKEFELYSSVMHAFFFSKTGIRWWSKEDLQKIRSLLEGINMPAQLTELFNEMVNVSEYPKIGNINFEFIYPKLEKPIQFKQVIAVFNEMILAKKYNMDLNLLQIFLFQENGSIRQWSNNDLMLVHHILCKASKLHLGQKIKIFLHWNTLKNTIKLIPEFIMSPSEINALLFDDNGNTYRWSNEELRSIYFLLKRIINVPTKGEINKKISYKGEQLKALFSNWNALREAIRLAQQYDMDVHEIQVFMFNKDESICYRHDDYLQQVRFLLEQNIRGQELIIAMLDGTKLAQKCDSVKHALEKKFAVNNKSMFFSSDSEQNKELQQSTNKIKCSG